jgi:hypothetical protein
MDDNIVAPGYIYSIGRTTPIMCMWGLHGSYRMPDAEQYLGYTLSYISRPRVAWLCHCRFYGKGIEGNNKIVCQHRHVLWMVPVALRKDRWELKVKNSLAVRETNLRWEPNVPLHRFKKRCQLRGQWPGGELC